MDISLRSMLTAGASVATATAIVLAPSVVPPTITASAPQAPARIFTPTRLVADVTPITQEFLQSVVTLVNNVAPGLKVPAAPALEAAPAPLNAASDVINSVYSFSRYWANYVSLDLTPWVLQFIPFGWVATDQISIWYQPFVLRTTDSFVYDFLDPIVNNPLNLGVWINSGIALANATISGLINGAIGEFNYLFGWILPPLPPLPGLASEDLTTQTLASATDVAAVPALAKTALAPLDKTDLADAGTVDAGAVGAAAAAATDAAAATETAGTTLAAADVAAPTAPAADVAAPVTTEPTVDPDATAAEAAVAQPAVQADAGAAADATPAADSTDDAAPAPDTTKAGDTAKPDAGAATDKGADKTDNTDKTDNVKPAKTDKAEKADKTDTGNPVKRTKDTPKAGEKAKARHGAAQHADAGSDAAGDHHKDASGD